MPYYVTSHGTDLEGRPAAAAIDTGTQPSGLALEDALIHAANLLSRNVPNVAITDGEGNSIRGEDLQACCAAEKTLTPDLRAIDKC